MLLNPLICPSCGGKINKDSSDNIWKCPYCDLMFDKTKNVKEIIVTKDDKPLEVEYELAKLAFDLGDYTKCLEHCTQILVNNEKDYLTWYLKGISIGLVDVERNFERAIECLLKAYEYSNNEELVACDIHNDIYDLVLVNVNFSIGDPIDPEYSIRVITSVSDYIDKITDILDILMIDIDQLVLAISHLISEKVAESFNELYSFYNELTYPDSEQWNSFICSTDRCIEAVSFACNLIEKYNISKANNINRYKSLNYMLDATIDSHSYTLSSSDGESKWVIDEQLSSSEKSNRRGTINTLTNFIKEIEPSYKKPFSACYIATAVYGSYSHPQVLVLRKYRDVVLKKRYLGRLFIKAYYRLSPALAKSLKNMKILNLLVKRILDKYIIYANKKTKLSLKCNSKKGA